MKPKPDRSQTILGTLVACAASLALALLTAMLTLARPARRCGRVSPCATISHDGKADAPQTVAECALATCGRAR